MALMRWACTCIVLMLGVWCSGAFAGDAPAPDILVDEAEVLSADAAAALRARLTAFEGQHQTAMAVVLVPSTVPDSIELRARQLAQAWQVGRQFQGRGMLLLLATQDRKVRLEVSTALAPHLSNEDAHRILTEQLGPGLRAGTPDAALYATLDALSAHLQASYPTMEASPASATPASAALNTSHVDDLSGKLWWWIGGSMLLSFVALGLVIWLAVAAVRFLATQGLTLRQPLLPWGGAAAALTLTALFAGWSGLLKGLVGGCVLVAGGLGVRALLQGAPSLSVGRETKSSAATDSGWDTASSPSSDSSPANDSASYEGNGASDSD